MLNGTAKIVGNKLVLELDLDGPYEDVKGLGLSQSQKTIKIAGSNGMEKMSGYMFQAAVWKPVNGGK